MSQLRGAPILSSMSLSESLILRKCRLNSRPSPRERRKSNSTASPLSWTSITVHLKTSGVFRRSTVVMVIWDLIFIFRELFDSKKLLPWKFYSPHAQSSPLERPSTGSKTRPTPPSRFSRTLSNYSLRKTVSSGGRVALTTGRLLRIIFHSLRVGWRRISSCQSGCHGVFGVIEIRGWSSWGSGRVGRGSRLESAAGFDVSWRWCWVWSVLGSVGAGGCGSLWIFF